MPADFLHRVDDHETAFAPIGSLAGTEDMVLVAAPRTEAAPRLKFWSSVTHGGFFALRSV